MMVHFLISVSIVAYNRCSEATNGAEVVARMLEHIARNKGYIPIPSPNEEEAEVAHGLQSPPRGRAVARAGAGRLRDAIVFGYMMQRHRARGKVRRGKGGGLQLRDMYPCTHCSLLMLHNNVVTSMANFH